MSLTKIQSTKQMLDWYVDIVQDWPSSKNLLFDLDADRNDELTDFLINAAYCIGNQITAESLIGIVEDYKIKMEEKIASQQDLTNILFSAIDSRISNFLANYDLEVSGNYDQILVEVSKHNVSADIQMAFSLTDSGYQPHTLRISEESYDTSSMEIDEFASLLHTKITS